MIPWRNLKRFFRKTLRQPGYAGRVFLKRLAAYATYRLGRGTSAMPEAITFFLTHRCNLHCTMCGQWGEGGVTKKHSVDYLRQELSFASLDKIVAEVACFKPNITLFGGEPLLHAHCIELICSIKRKGMHCLVITNGSLLSQAAEELVATGLDELNLSLDGDASIHDTIRGMPGLFDTIMAGLGKINAAKAKAARKKPLVNLQCTITQYNYTQLERLIEVAVRAHADSLTFHNLIFLTPESIAGQKEYDRLLGCSSQDWEGFVFSPQIDPEILFRQMQAIRSRRYPFDVDFYPNFTRAELIDYYRKPDSQLRQRRLRCLSPWMVGYVFADGQLRPCLNSTYSFGNIQHTTFQGAWNSERAVDFRTALRKNRAFPACVRCTELYRY